MFSVLFSAVGSILYLFGGSNYPESEECLDGLYAYDIGKVCINPFVTGEHLICACDLTVWLKSEFS